VVRKATLELVRSQPYMSGYVVTGLADTPISTAGLFDDVGKDRFTAEEFTPFNGDTVIFVEPDRRRDWLNGGDRPHYLDRYCVWGGQEVRRHVGVSHYGPESGVADLKWTVTLEDGRLLAQGNLERPKLKPGDTAPLGLFTFTVPPVERPGRLILTCELRLPGRTLPVTNRWTLWAFPKPIKQTGGARVGLYDPAGHLRGFADAVGYEPVPLAAADGRPTDSGPDVAVVVATAWRPELQQFAARGGRVLLLQPAPSEPGVGGGLPAEGLPFWREAMRLFEPHPSWGDFPHGNITDLLFYGIGPDCAFIPAKVRDALGAGAQIAPVLTRVDARTIARHAYTLEAQIGRGLLLLTTLRVQGGLGDQASGLARNVAGVYLLRTWLDWLART